ncbi:hypothetical protein SAMN02745244_01933 [Tessaracoccus bendigoensis DSM 12906]|uniref:Uncharacterized protein n=1 Tax=Tessaracoccus bendigoensis DSM 12906 TaxID=1123357 RepID=A0A1M6HAG6_9ACTN|nr:hypothetical protein [Tessaracoccus bendigoensis]SHJ19221.1 hypothetical protein SAMN02745244_01933 [Tessaracoccus bendigoensis DSM 12906]
MGILGRLFGRDEEADTVTVTAFDCARVRPDIEALINALGQLADAMDGEDSPMSNPGWRGRLRDLRDAAGGLRLLTRGDSFTRDELFEVLTTIRPLYRGTPPKGFAHLANLNTLVVHRIEAVYLSAT